MEDRRENSELLRAQLSRPPVAEDRLALTSSDHVRHQLETPYRDGTTQIVLEPLDLVARLAALVPPPRLHLTRYHGVFAPDSLRGTCSRTRRRPSARLPPAPERADEGASVERARRRDDAAGSRRQRSVRQGFASATPHSSKSLVFRVARLAPAHFAIAAIIMSTASA